MKTNTYTRIVSYCTARKESLHLGVQTTATEQQQEIHMYILVYGEKTRQLASSSDYCRGGARYLNFVVDELRVPQVL